LWFILFGFQTNVLVHKPLCIKYVSYRFDIESKYFFTPSDLRPNINFVGDRIIRKSSIYNTVINAVNISKRELGETILSYTNVHKRDKERKRIGIGCHEKN